MIHIPEAQPFELKLGNFEFKGTREDFQKLLDRFKLNENDTNANSLSYLVSLANTQEQMLAQHIKNLGY